MLNSNTLNSTTLNGTSLMKPLSVYQPQNGQVVTSPDGYLLVVGADVNGNLGFWKIANGSVAGSWQSTPNVILATVGNWDNTVNASVAVSDWINNGSFDSDTNVITGYVVDACWVVPSGITNEVYMSRSFDGGNTFGTATYNNFTQTHITYVNVATPVLRSQDAVDALVMFISNNTGIPFQCFYFQSFMASAISIPSSVTFNNHTFNIGPTGGFEADWVVNSMASFYDKISNEYIVAISGYESYFGTTQSGIYLFRIVQPPVTSSFRPIATQPIPVMPSLSTSPQNQNNFTLPALNYDGTNLWLTYRAELVETIDENNNITTITNYFISRSTDFINFNYPMPITLNTGQTFVGDHVGLPVSAYSFASQDGYYYLAGGGSVWQFSKNDLIADVSASVLSYEVSETAGAPSSITVDVGNQNGEWIGPSPTQPNYSAISKNKKVFLNQGYYLPDGTTQTVPKSVYLIDDVTQNIDYQHNDFTVSGRDQNYKNLAVMNTRFSYSWKGPDFIVDNFNTTAVSATPTPSNNWSSINGSWGEMLDSIYGIGVLTPSSLSAGDNVASLSAISLTEATNILSVCVKLPDPVAGNGEHVYVYPIWIDSTHYLQFYIKANGTNFSYGWNDSGSSHSLSTSYNPGWSATNNFVNLYVVSSNFSSYVYVRLGQTAYPLNTVNTINQYDSAIQVGVIPSTINTPLASATVALGTDTFSGAEFAFFKFYQPSISNSIEDMTRRLGTLSGVFGYDFQDNFVIDNLQYSQYKGTSPTSVSSSNGMLSIASNDFATFTIGGASNNGVIDNTEINFNAQIISQTPAPSKYQFDVLIRNQVQTNLNNSYILSFVQVPTVSTYPFYSYITLSEVIGGVSTTLMGTLDSPNLSDLTHFPMGMVFDLTQPHSYKVTANLQWFYVYIDGVPVFAWYDNAVDSSQYASGYYGFSVPSAVSNTVNIWDVSAPTFFSQIPTYSVNPGDSFQNDINNIIDTVQGWAFTDLMGNYKVITLGENDPVTYNYGDNASQNIMWNANTNASDKEYVNEVQVVGLGVSALVRNSQSIGTNVTLRSEVVVDYSITTLKAAQQRAQQELINFNKFNSQPSPKQVNNIGSELFDVVNIDSTDNPNSLGINLNQRIYNQDVNMDGSSNEDSIELQLGSLSGATGLN